MGLITDYFIARDDAEAMAVLSIVGGPTASDSSVREVVPLRRVFPWTEGLTLTAAAGNLRPDELGDWLSDEPLAIEDDGEVLLVRMPDEFRRHLAAIEPERILAVATIWNEYEDIDGEEEVPGEAVGTVQSVAEMRGQIVADLHKLCRSAGDSGTNVYCWVCV